MKRLALLLSAAAAATLVACHDDDARESSAPTEPVAPVLSTAAAEESGGAVGAVSESSICVSYRATRDSLAAELEGNPSDTGLKENVAAWDAALTNLCR